MRFSWTISWYFIRAVAPYFVFSWLLLSVILFVQQGSRFSDIFFSVNIPSNLVWQLTFALVPSVIAFTCPMAVLVGVIIGLSKMQGDSELVAIRAAGVANLQIAVPVFVLGILLSVFAFFVNLYGVPLAASIVRKVALQTAIYKLESPIEPGVFNTEVAGYTIYIKDGDLESGNWKNIFVYNEDEKTGIVRLITATNGRIDSSGELSELVLENAVSSTFSKGKSPGSVISEHIGEIRYAIKTRRGELIQRLSSTELTPEELGLAQLSSYAQTKDGRDRIEAEILWQRRIILSLSPLIFCLLGTALVLRFSRKGRGFAILLALISLIAYFLLAFLGEQLARVGRISAFEGSLIPLVFSFAAMAWFYASGRIGTAARWPGVDNILSKFRLRSLVRRRPSFFVDLTTGLRDFDITINLAKFYLLALGFLGSVFVIFTAFELWKFAGTIDNGVWLLSKYLFFLLPFMYVQLAPSAAMIATLATYVIKSRQNEIVTWTSAGQSVYRLLFPCLIFMIAVGAFNWLLQEYVLPAANERQDALRTQIRSRGLTENRPGKLWVANDRRIYAFYLDKNASDNEIRVQELSIYEFANDKTRLQSVYRVERAIWGLNRIVFDAPAERIDLARNKAGVVAVTGGIDERSNPFIEARKKPSHLTAGETRMQIENSESDVERRTFEVALEKKYSTAFLPFIIALFTAPFALSLSRKGKVVTVGYAVGLWLLFMGITSVFEQFGLNGGLSPTIAVWSPLALFSIFGIYLLSRVRT